MRIVFYFVTGREKHALREAQRATILAHKDAVKAAQEARKLAKGGIGAQPWMLFQDGWRRCNCTKSSQKSSR